MRRREGIPHETANAMVDMAAAVACCLVGGSAHSRSVATGDGSAAADGGAEHGAAKPVGYSLDAVFRQVSAACCAHSISPSAPC